MKINYVIASWGGPRHGYADSLTVLKYHIEKLQTLTHNISQVTIGYPQCNWESKEYTNYIYDLECKGKLSDNTKLEIFKTNNYGMSYGQYGRIFRRYRNQFDAYIIVEDDYIPTLPNLDTALYNMMQEQNVGYLCGLCMNESGKYGAIAPEHAAISNGIISTSCLEAVLDKFGVIPSVTGDNQPSQITFSQAVIKSGQKIGDYVESGKYRCTFWDHMLIRIYGKSPLLRDIFVPYQYAISPAMLVYRYIKKWPTS